MSRQFDEYMMNKVEINGELCELVEPDNFSELMEAYEMKDKLQTQYSSCMHDDDSADGWLNLLQEQEEYIQDYLENLEEFDNSCLISNIDYLAKKIGMRYGDLEKALGLSAGYISRTAKADSKKKLSIDVVWKIAKLFEVDMNSLLERDLSDQESNTALVGTFIDRLTEQTKLGEIEWKSNGGVLCFLQDKYREMGLVTEDKEGTAVYHPAHMDPEIKWRLEDDIFSCNGIDSENELVIIPFKRDKNDAVFYDFIWTWTTGEKSEPENLRYHWEKAFYSEDDRYGELRKHADELYQAIQKCECDAKISQTTRKIIKNYLK